MLSLKFDDRLEFFSMDEKETASKFDKPEIDIIIDISLEMNFP